MGLNHHPLDWQSGTLPRDHRWNWLLELIVKCLNCLSKLTAWTDSEISELADWIDHLNWLSKLTVPICSSIGHHWLFLDADDQDVVDTTAPQHSKTRLLTFKKVVKHWKAVSSTTSGSTCGKGGGQMSCPRCREVNGYRKLFEKII